MRKKMTAIMPVLMLLLTAVVIPLAGARTIDDIEFPPLRDIRMPDVEKVELNNGIVLYLLEDHQLPLVEAMVRIGAGGYLDPPEKTGLASMMATVMRTGGTDKMTGDEIDEALESIGASIETSMGSTSGNVSMNILSEYADTGLEILADILRQPVFAEDKIGLARTAERTAIARRNDDAWPICIREFRKIVYGSESPYARHTEYATIDNIAREDMIEYHRQYVTPRNLMIAVWGDFDREEMLAELTALFGDWSSDAPAPPPPPEVTYEFEPGIHYAEKDNVTQTNILIGHIGGFLDDPDYHSLIVMNNVLSGSFAGRLFNEVRSKKGLAYAVGGKYISNIEYPGIFYNYCFTKSESTVEAVRAVINEIQRMQTVKPTAEEMKKAKDGYLNSFVFKFDSKKSILSRMMDYDYHGFPSDFLFTVKDKLEGVTADDVQRVARDHLQPNNMHVVVVGRGEDFDESLSVLGQVDTIDISIPTGEPKDDVALTEESLTRGMEFLKMAVDACGGKNQFDDVKSLSSRGTMTITIEQTSLPVEQTSYYVFPDQTKDVIASPMLGGEIVTAINGESGWMTQGGQTIDLGAEQMKEMQGDLFRNTFRVFKLSGEPDYQAAYAGREEVAGVPADIVKIISLDGEMSFKLALAADTHLPVAKMYFGQTMTGPANLVQIFGDYRDISGIKVPFEYTIEADGNQMGSMVVESFEINPDIPEDSFDRP